MTDDTRFEQLEDRVTRLETQLAADIRRIFEKLEALTVSSVKGACPSPGACVQLGSELQHVIVAHNATMLRVERLEIQLIKLNQQKAWLLGVWSAVAFFSSIVGALIAVLINYYIRK